MLPTTTTIVPFGNPSAAFSDQNIDDFYYHVVDKCPELAVPSIKTCKLERGKMLVVCTDGQSTNLVRKILEKLAFRPKGSNKQVPILIIPNDEVLSRITLSCILDGFVDWDEFLKSVGPDGFDGSFWVFRDADLLSSNQYKIKFSVDGISFFQLIENGLKMKIDGKGVNVKVEVNPFEADMNSFARGNDEIL